jgi:glycosyltransferase involved in cell wall biosynthesis
LFNYAHHVGSCLDSVLAQTLAPLDLVVVDDRSTDSSAAVVGQWFRQHADRFAYCELVRHRTNRGLARTRNTAFGRTKSPYVFVLDADNLLYPRCLDRLKSALDHCRATFAYCYAERFGDVSGLLNVHPWNPAHFQINNTIDAMALLRRSAWEAAGGYSTDMPVMGWEDFDLWFKMARQKGWGILVPEILARYRVHGTSMLRAVTNPRVEILRAHMRATYAEFFSEPLGVAPPLDWAAVA